MSRTGRQRRALGYDAHGECGLRMGCPSQEPGLVFITYFDGTGPGNKAWACHWCAVKTSSAKHPALLTRFTERADEPDDGAPGLVSKRGKGSAAAPQG